MLRKTTLHAILLNSFLGLALLWGPSVLADPVDAVADTVFGQPDFTSNSINAGGGPSFPSSSSVSFAVDVTVDATGNVYVADMLNNRVLIYLDPQNTDTVADVVLGQPDFVSNGANNGGLVSGLWVPRGVTVDTVGNVYVADWKNNRVVVYFDPLNTDALADAVLGQPDFTSNIANNGGISASSLQNPNEVTVDSTGNVYIADSGNNRVLEYHTPLTTDTVADVVFGKTNFTTGGCNLSDTTGGSNASSAGSLCIPHDVVVDIAGNVYTTDAGNHRVLVYFDPLTTDTMADVVFGHTDFVSRCGNCGGLSASSLAAPRRVVVDVAGNVYVADSANRRVLEYHTPLTTDTVADVVLGQPDFTSNAINNGGLSASSLFTPEGVAIDAAGNVYVADTGNERVLGYDGISPTTATALTCTGYEPPFATPLALKKKSKRTIPLKMTLTNSEGTVITDSDVEAPPVVNVLFGGQVYGEVPPDSDNLLPNGGANDDNIFRFDDSENKWVYNLDSKQFAAPGVYTVKPVAGDDSYTIGTSVGCLQTFERLN